MIYLVVQLSRFLRRIEYKARILASKCERYVLKKRCPEHWQEIEDIVNKIKKTMENPFGDSK